MTPTDLVALVRDSAERVLTGRGAAVEVVDAQVGLARSRDARHGDYASAVALRMAGSAGVSPRALARWVADDLAGRREVGDAEVAGPGFVNIWLAPATARAVIAAVLVGPTPSTDRDEAHDRAHDRARDDETEEFRYAHARLCAIARHAADLGVHAGSQLELLTDAAERELVDALDVPGGRLADPGRLRALVEAVHRFDAACRVLPMGDEPTTERHRARVTLCDAARRALATGLRGLGATAPERM